MNNTLELERKKEDRAEQRRVAEKGVRREGKTASCSRGGETPKEQREKRNYREGQVCRTRGKV